MKDETVFKIILKLLSAVLALATEQIDQGRLSIYCISLLTITHGLPCDREICKPILEVKDVESVIRRLGRLTLDESRMTITQILNVVYGLVLVNTMQVVMEGAHRQFV